MATMTFDPKGYGGIANLAIIAQGILFWWDNNGVMEPALRLITPEPDHHYRAVHFPKGKLPKYVQHNPADDAIYNLMAGGAVFRVDGIPSGPCITSGEKAGTICVGDSSGDAILCATSPQGVVKIDLKTYEVTTATNLGRAPFKHWSVGTMDVNGDFFPFYSR